VTVTDKLSNNVDHHQQTDQLHVEQELTLLAKRNAHQFHLHQQISVQTRTVMTILHVLTIAATLLTENVFTLLIMLHVTITTNAQLIDVL
jgi:hypothetical protein